MRFQIPTHQEEQLPATKSKEEKPQYSHILGEAPSSTSMEGEPPKCRGKSSRAPSPKMSTDSPSRKSSHHGKCSPPSKEHQDTCEWAEKEPHLKGPSLTFNASSQSRHSSPSRHLIKTDDQASFVDPNSTSTSSKTGGGPCFQSVSSNSMCSMTSFEMGFGGSFSVPSYAGVHCGSITPVTSIAGLQQVTGSGWHQSASFSPLTPQVTDTLSAEQAAEVYQLSAECWALGSKLAK